MVQTAQSALADFRDALLRRDPSGVTQAGRALLDHDAPLGAQWRAVAQALQQNGEHGGAIAAIECWRRQDGVTPASGFALAAVLARAGRTAAAQAELDRIGPDDVEPAGLAYTRGVLALNLGDVDRARAELLRAATLNPESGQAWLALAMTGALDRASADALRQAARPFAVRTDVEAGAYWFAMARIEDADGDPTAAFAAVDKGASIMRALRPVDMAADDALTDRLTGSWTGDSIRKVNAQVESGGGPKPIIVTGLPRSGTTLVEHILVSHSAVKGGDELGLFSRVQQQLGADPQNARPEALRAARSLYQHLARERFDQSGDAIVDKTLVASRNLGLVAGLFPEAPIVWLRRDPADCAWSAYRSFFLSSVDWSWSLDHIGHFFRNEDRLFDHWTKLLGDRILVVPFEEMVADSRGWIDRITRFAGLEPEPAQYEAHRSDRAVTTNSAVQVREPIDRRGLDVALPHVARMKPFFDAYAGDEVSGGS